MMLAIKQPVGPTNFLRKTQGGIQVSGFMGKHPGIIRGVTLQPHPAMTAATPKNTLERV